MTRDELNAKNKTDLLALAAAAGLAATPAMTKNDLVELVLAGAAMAAASAPPAPIPAPPVADISDNGTAARIAELEAQLAAANGTIAEQAKNVVATDKLVVDNGEGLPKLGALRALDGSLAGTRKMRVTIMATEAESDDVKLGVNGHLVQVKRGVPVILDVAYVEVLRNSTIDTMIQDDDGVKKQVQMQRYPFTAEPV